MTGKKPPKFTKTNHHYVPQFWLKRFCNSKGELWARKWGGGRIRPTSTEKIMSEDWLYTDFNEHWQPSDTVEDKLSLHETDAGNVFAALHASPAEPTDQQWSFLCWWLALTACRHPNTMARAHVTAKELAYSLADASAMTEPIFLKSIHDRYGVALAEGTHHALTAWSDAALLAEAQEVESMSSQDPRLPALISLTATFEVATRIANMDLLLLETTSDKAFVIGDVPVPISNLAAGFCTPLSSRLAIGAWPRDDGQNILRGRKAVTSDVVDLVNQDQADRSQKIVVGPYRASLVAIPKSE